MTGRSRAVGVILAAVLSVIISFAMAAPVAASVIPAEPFSSPGALSPALAFLPGAALSQSMPGPAGPARAPASQSNPAPTPTDNDAEVDSTTVSAVDSDSTSTIFVMIAGLLILLASIVLVVRSGSTQRVDGE